MHHNHLKTLNFETQLSLDLSCIWDWWKGSEGKEQDADFTHHMMDNISILVPPIIFLDIVAHDINVLEDRSFLRERYFSILAYQAEKVLNFPQKVHLLSLSFFFKSFKSVWFLFHFRPWWWIQYNHKENQNGTHAHSSQLSTITIKIMTHTGKSGPFFCVDISFLSSSSSFSLDNNALACSARSLALCLAYIFFTCSTPALLELFSSTNFWETWDKAAFSLKSRVIWGCFGSFYQILLFDWTS